MKKEGTENGKEGGGKVDRLRRIARGSGLGLGGVFLLGFWARAQGAAEESGIGEAAAGGLTPWSAIVVLGTLVLVLGGILVYLAVERRRA